MSLNKMERPADENLPEVVQFPHQSLASSQPLPEVVPDSSPEAAQQRFYMETDKYPAYYDTAPKLPHEQPAPPGSLTPEQHYQQSLWSASGHPVSAMSPNSSVPWQSIPQHDDQQTYVGSEPPEEKRICGLRKRLFIIIAAILGLIIVAAAIGGGVGGAMAAKQKSSDETQGADAAAPDSSGSSGGGSGGGSGGSSSTTPTPTSSSTVSKTSSIPTPTISFLNNQTDPTLFQLHSFQGFSEANFTGKATPILYDELFYDFDFNVTSYMWIPNKTNCCITYCHGPISVKDQIGHWCDARRRIEVPKGDRFSRLSIWCGRWSNTEMEQRCS